ncbi:MAG: hydantoinase/oxoprolinase family protein, partial [Steroidobacteraceae bacterium]
LMTDLQTNYAQTRLMTVAADALPAMHEVFSNLQERAIAWFASEGIEAKDRHLRRSIDMRYRGQNYELPIAVPDHLEGNALLGGLRRGFEHAHQQMYGYVAPEEPMQAVTFRIEATGAVRQAELREHAAVSVALETALVTQRDVWLAESAAFVSCPVYDRERLGFGHRIRGPAIVEQMDATTLVLPGQSAIVDRFLNLIVEG